MELLKRIILEDKDIIFGMFVGMLSFNIFNVYGSSLSLILIFVLITSYKMIKK